MSCLAPFAAGGSVTPCAVAPGSAWWGFLGLPLQIAMDCSLRLSGCDRATRSDSTIVGSGARTAAGNSTSAAMASLNRVSLSSDDIARVVFCRLRYRLTLRDLSERKR
jgi:hypothetical protein